MRSDYLAEFLGEDAKNSAVAKAIGADESELAILQQICELYVLNGVGAVGVFELTTHLGKEKFTHLNYLEKIKNLIDNGWIAVCLSSSKILSINENLLSLLHAEVMPTQNLLNLLQNGVEEIKFLDPSPYNERYEYLKDQFFRVYLYEKKSMLGAKKAKELLNDQICECEKYIKSRLALSKNQPKIEKIMKENSLNEKEQIIFLALLKQEFLDEETSIGESENLIKLISDNEFEKASLKFCLAEGSKLLELIDYDEIFKNDDIVQRFFIKDEILDEIMHQNANTSGKIKLENLVKEQEIFELIEPRTDINDVVLNDKTKELLEQILKQVDRKVLSRLSSWGIKNRKGIDAKIIFYGEPGTGKTMSALSLAKSLKKAVLSFDCSKILSKYVGESEQNVRKIFDSYKEICKKSKSEPLLLLNEADQFLSTRVEGGDSVDKMHNQMQNIFLEQIERFEGVLVATTNFLQSFDGAFSRRFDYKIEFKKPDFAARLAIWRKVLPENACYEDGFMIEKLANYNLSGGQIMLVLKNTALKVATKEDGIFTFEDFKANIDTELNSAFGGEKKVGFN